MLYDPTRQEQLINCMDCMYVSLVFCLLSLCSTIAKHLLGRPFSDNVELENMCQLNCEIAENIAGYALTVI